MISRISHSPMRTRFVLLAVAVFTVVGGAFLPRIAYAAPTTVNASSPQKVELDSGTSTVNVTFTLSGDDNPNIVTVPYETRNGSAAAGSDYDAKSGTVTFAAHQSGQSQTVQFVVRGDTTFEGNETFTVFMGTPTGGAAKGSDGTVTIIDDDSKPTVTIDDLSHAEGQSGPTAFVFIVRLSNSSGVDSKVHVKSQLYTKTPDNALDRTSVAEPEDFTVIDTDITILAGQTMATASVPVNGDLVDESDEAFEVWLSAATTGPGNVIIPAFNTDPSNRIDPSDNRGIGTITNDDTPPQIFVSDVSANEGNNPGCASTQPAPDCETLDFVISLSAISEKTVDVNFTTEDRSATAGSDYEPDSGTQSQVPPDQGGAFEIPAGQQSAILSVNIIGDTIPETAERMALILSVPVNATIGDGEGIGVILNDDAGGSFPTVSIANAADVTEADSATASFAITATFPVGAVQPVTVSWATADGPEAGGADAENAAKAPGDYVEDSGEVTLVPPTGGPGATMNATVSIVNDTLDESDERFRVVLVDAVNANIGDATGEAKIVDDDAEPVLSITGKTVTEGSGGGTADAIMTVTLDAASDKTVTVDYATADATAVEPGDYVETIGTLTFAPGEVGKTFAVPVVRDAMDENNETVSLALSSPTNATLAEGEDTAVLTINDDDNPPTVSINNASVTEGSSSSPTLMSFDVILSTPSGKPVTVNATTANATAIAPGDYTSQTNSLITIPAGQGGGTFTVSVVADTTDELDETFNVTLSGPTNATIAPGGSTGLGNIVDDDSGPTPTVSISNASATEGAAATFTLTLSSSSNSDVTVNLESADGTATAPADYTAVPDTTTVVIPAGQTSKTFDAQTAADSVDEANETFTLSIVDATNATVSSTNDTGTATIIDDDGTGGNITTGPGPGGGPHIIVFEPNGTNPGPSFMDGAESSGKRVARADLDGDGVDEIITGSGPGSAAVVSVYNAAGQFLASSFAYANGSFYGGVFVAAGDVDGDGKAEIVTAPGAGGGPHVRVWEYAAPNLVGNDGFFAYGSNFTGGVTVAVGDLDGDGKDDIITGAGAGGGPHMRAFAAANAPAEMWGVMAYSPAFTGGLTVAAGDLDGDGKAEVVTGVGPGGGPHMRTFNRDGTLRNGGIYAFSENFTGGIAVAAGDLDGDGNAEIAVSPLTQANRVKGYRADLSSLPGTDFAPYGAFGGGNYVAIGTS